MKTWLRLILVVFTVGGGFTLITGATDVLFRTNPMSLTAVMLLGFMMASGAFIMASGLVLVRDPRCTRLAQIALALQIPWVSSPLFAFRLFCGVGLYAVVGLEPPEDVVRVGDHFGWRFQLGAYSSVGFWENHPWSLGINLVALFLLVALRASMRPVRIVEQSVADDARTFQTR